MNQIDNYDRIIFFDGVCNFCNASVNLVMDNDPKEKFRYASLQSEAAKLYLDSKYYSGKLDSIVYLNSGKILTKSTAALYIAKEMKGFWSVLYYLLIWIPPFIRDFFYTIIANNRYKWFGKTESCRIPDPEKAHLFL
ncbi:MAG: DCC1-like thiol-disulfide oxidoreductase family protein [Bacteroidota bacterium]|nr:DCC1-like thiol-disulfide oxidoreductase family protein [Bacteroidota bacterium]